jgi:YfiR/HmsC-like
MGWRKVVAFVVLIGALLGATRGVCGDSPALTESQVKGLFLFNFAKYTYWPAEVFPDTNSMITIGVLGDAQLSSDLAKIVAGKTVNGRKIVAVPMDLESNFKVCQILFIGDSHKKFQAEILAKVKGQPVLTVGESEDFNDRGGVIQFTKREGKVRLEVNLDAARAARLAISAKLLSVADKVKGKL